MLPNIEQSGLPEYPNLATRAEPTSRRYSGGKQQFVQRRSVNMDRTVSDSETDDYEQPLIRHKQDEYIKRGANLRFASESDVA